MDFIKIILSVMIGRTSCFSLLHSYVYESLDRNELLISQQCTGTIKKLE